jgi:lysophospholipase L1-like esterase
LIFDLLGKHIPPNYLVVHCGGNDIAQSPLKNTEPLAIQTIQEIQSVAANIKIIWSQILPRLVWRNEINHTKLNKARRRFNTILSKYCIQTGGAYIRYPQISENRKYLYRDNVLIISGAGNDIFISNLKHGLNAIIYGAASATCFPED